MALILGRLESLSDVQAFEILDILQYLLKIGIQYIRINRYMKGHGSNPPFMAGVPELLILSLLKDREEMYGYEIVAAIGDATGRVVSLKEGVVYPLLHALEEGGLLQDAASSRERTNPGLLHPDLQGVRRLFDLTDEWRRMQGAVARTLARPANPHLD